MTKIDILGWGWGLNCIENRPWLNTKNELFTENDIDKEYEKVIEDLDKKSCLYPPANSVFQPMNKVSDISKNVF